MKYRSDIDVYEVKPSEASQWGSVCPQFRFQIRFSAATVRIYTSCEIKIKKQDQISLKFNITVSISDCIHIYHRSCYMTRRCWTIFSNFLVEPFDSKTLKLAASQLLSLFCLKYFQIPIFVCFYLQFGHNWFSFTNLRFVFVVNNKSACLSIRGWNELSCNLSTLLSSTKEARHCSSHPSLIKLKMLQ